MWTRHLFLKLSENRTLRRWMETSPDARRLTSRFIAGETLGQELDVCAGLERQRIWAALDHLGESVTTQEEAAQSAEAYLRALEAIAGRKLASTVSIKITQFGVDLSESACLDNVVRLVEKAKSTGSRVEIDMESSRYTERTLDIAERASAAGPVRCVIQAYLHRSHADVERLNRLRIPVRLCKGAYDEPVTVAFPTKADVDRHYVQLTKKLLDEGTYPAIATHDPKMLDAATAYARDRGIAFDRFEFQMLYGIRSDLQRKLVDQGYRLRLYVPYGTAWYPYFMRRLAERPANVWFIARSFFH
jgi:proline dehydrogenase